MVTREGLAFTSNSLRCNTTTLLSASFLFRSDDVIHARMRRPGNFSGAWSSWHWQVVSCTKSWTSVRFTFGSTWASIADGCHPCSGAPCARYNHKLWGYIMPWHIRLKKGDSQQHKPSRVCYEGYAYILGASCPGKYSTIVRPRQHAAVSHKPFQYVIGYT